MKILDNIHSSLDLQSLNIKQCRHLCSEIRDSLVNSISKTGGHLASNLGVVELTVAIHKVFDVYTDRIIFDVGHQSYVHKMLTGRLNGMHSIRAFGGISGFPKPSESFADAFIGGHASNSISVALGMARARTLNKENYKVACLIGDGALTGGLSYEGMNNAGLSGEPVIVILNDNGMSITKNVGAIARLLAHERVKPAYYSFKKHYRKIMYKLPGGRRFYRFTHNVKSVIKQALLHCSMFEEMGFRYFGPVDGHDIEKLVYYLSHAAASDVPCIVHVVTKKGRGYEPAEENPDKYHGIEPFNPREGIESGHTKKSFSSVFGDTLTRLAGKDQKICAITAAMPSGTGLDVFAKHFPDRFFDEGIAEGHAATMAAGMSKQGMIPVFAVYSTFLQRAFDMLVHDIAISRLHVVLAVDRAGIVGGDGETHQGIFDIGFLSLIPGMTVFCPASFSELERCVETAVYMDSPVAVRYPRGSEGAFKGGDGRDSVLSKGDSLTIVSYGVMINEALQVVELLAGQGIGAELVKLIKTSPLDITLVEHSVRKTKKLLVIEDVVSAGGVGERLAAGILENGIKMEKVLLKNTGTGFVTNGSVPELLKSLRLDAESIAEDTIQHMFGGNV